MISLKKYLDSAPLAAVGAAERAGILQAALTAYGSALVEMGNCSLNACPGLGASLKQRLEGLKAGLNPAMTRETVQATERGVQEQLRDWGLRTARHYQEKASEVKELLLLMTRAAEGVGARDQRCAGQMSQVTERLKRIASLDDLTEIRASIEKSAAELKSSIARMTEESKAAAEVLRKQVSTYQAKLEEAEEIASRDALTGVRSRLCTESHIESRMAAGAKFCLAMVDIDDFKRVNDEHGHVTGDELLKEFAGELCSVCRATDVIGRWGGDEFVVLLDCSREEASERIERLRRWVCGDYTVAGKSGAIKLRLDASIGVAECVRGESMKALVARADAAMYAVKAMGREQGSEGLAIDTRNGSDRAARGAGIPMREKNAMRDKSAPSM
jgi:diguanylate cyclase (GGDEF)-like protein